MIEIIIFVEHINAELVCCRKMIMLQGAHGEMHSRIPIRA